MTENNEPKTSEKSEKKEKTEKKRKSWEDLVFGALETIASAPQKLKDPKESVSTAIEWVKSLKMEMQDKASEEIRNKISELDWNKLSEQALERIFKNYDLNIKVSFKPKNESKSADKE